MTADVELLPCGECGMPCRPGEYHPYAACLMFKTCRNSDTVRGNLQDAQDHATAAKDAEIDALRTRLEDTVRDSTSKIEALRAEVAAVKESLTTELRLVRGERDRAMQACETIAGHLAKAEARADKLAEALRDAADDLERGIDARIVVAQARAALRDQEEGREQ